MLFRSGNTASPNINGLLPWLSNSTKILISSIALLASLPALAWTTRHKGIEVGIWAALPIAVICSFHAYTQDILLSIPLALLAIGTGLAHSRISGVFLLSPVSTYALAAWIPMLGPAIAIASILWVAWTIRDLPDNNASLILSLEAESRD